MQQITPEFLIACAGIVLSLAFSYIPGLEAKFATLDGIQKRLLMLLLLLTSTLILFGVACLNWGTALGIDGLACTQNGAIALTRSFGIAVIANQTTFLITPKRASK
jgi:hypothetical protein